MNYIVQLITNIIRGKKYYGVDVNHKVNNRKNDLSTAIRKYGEENFIYISLF